MCVGQSKGIDKNNTFYSSFKIAGAKVWTACGYVIFRCVWR